MIPATVESKIDSVGVERCMSSSSVRPYEMSTY